MSHARWGKPGQLKWVAGRIAVALAVAAMLAGSPEVVGAASAPRLSGHFQVTLTITKEKYSLYQKGEKYTRDWAFAPECASGGCTTNLTVTDPNGDLHSTFHPSLKNGKWRYAALVTYDDNCYAADGTTLIKKNGYSSTVKLVLNAGHVSGGMITSFTGSYSLSFTATSAAKALGCPASGYAKGNFKSD